MPWPLIIVDIIIVIIVFAVIIVIRSFYIADKTGKRGERIVARMLESIRKKRGGYIINNVILPIHKWTTQVDHIYFSKEGIFVIETKNYSGEITGNETIYKWKQVIGYRRIHINKLPNPIRQNAAHVYAVQELIFNEDIPVYSIVIFVKADISHIRNDKVHNLKTAKEFILKCPEVLDDEQVLESYKIIKAYKDKPIISEEEHIRRIKEKYHDDIT